MRQISKKHDFFYKYYSLVNTDQYDNYPLSATTHLKINSYDDLSLYKNNVNDSLKDKGWCWLRLNFKHNYEEIVTFLEKGGNEIIKDSGIEKRNYTRIKSSQKGIYFANTCFGQPLHMDDAHTNLPPRFITLYCQKTAQTGGISTLCLLQECLSSLSKKSIPNTAFAKKALTINGSHGLLQKPLFIKLENKKIGSSFPSILFEIQCRKDIFSFYKYILDYIHDPAHQIRFKMLPKDLLVLDNYRVFHGRTKFFKSSKRLLYRTCFNQMQL